MPEKPSWDTSSPGTSPLLTAPVTKEEIEAGRRERARFQAAEQYTPLADSRLRGPDTVFLNAAIRNELAHSANLQMLHNRKLTIPDRRERRTHHKRELFTALWQQGKIDEALKVASNKNQRAHVLKIREAVEKPDDADCGCEREVVDGLTLCRRFDTGIKVLSALHGRVVSIWECSRCRDWNALPETPERQAAIAARAIALRSQGVTPTDAHLLKL